MITLAEQNKKEQKDKIVSGVITLAIAALIFLFLWWIKIITPIPPFPEMAGGGGQEINFGIYNEGTGNVEGPGIGDASSVVVENKEATPVKESAPTEEDFKNGEAVLENNDSKPKIKNNETVITPVKPVKETKKEDDKSTKNLLNAYTHSKNNSQSGGDGNSGNAGNEGSPEGNPNTDGKGGHGGGPQGEGIGTGPGIHGGPGGFSYGLNGRKMLTPPPKVSDSKEEGIVVVIITVDKDGNVIDADATGKGTNTTSATLKSKARQAAKLAKFSPSTQYETQKGTIVFKFEF